MNPYAVLTLVVFAFAFVSFLTAFFTRMMPCAKVTRRIFFVLAALAVAAFMFWGIARNF